MITTSGSILFILLSTIQGIISRLKLIRLKAGNGMSLMLVEGIAAVDGYPIIETSNALSSANVAPSFSNIRVSSTGLSTEAKTILLFFITCDKVDIYRLN